jgi:hypothetical protein
VAWDRAELTVSWGKANVTKTGSGKVPGKKLGATPGFVVLSDVGKLPWGRQGERGGIYTWEDETFWTLEADCYLLAFSLKPQN